MASDDNPLQPLINPSTSIDSPHLKYTDSIPSTTINMTSHPTSSKKKRPSVNIKALRQHLKKRESSVKDVFMINLSRRLASRKELQTRLSKVTDIMCLLALLGLVLMIIENEIKFAQVHNRETPASWALKLIITLSTIFLVALVFLYHRLDLSLYAINRSTDDWCIGLTYRRIIIIILEVVVCALHPLVPAFPKDSPTTIEQSILNANLIAESAEIPVPVDIILSLIMFLRCYLLCRFAIYHSQLTHNVGLRSLGYLNQVSINFLFLVKTSLIKWPARSLLSFLIIVWLIGSWALRACDYSAIYVHPPMVDTMWFFIVTYTTVGYGDIKPSTYCGRGIAVIIAFVGLLSGALLIAVVSQKLSLNRWERYLYDFVLNAELAKQHKFHSANIIKLAMQMWTSKRHRDVRSNIQQFGLKRKMFQTINSVHKIKQQQRELIDDSVGLPEVAISQRTADTIADTTIRKIENLESKIDNLEEKFLDMKESINTMQNTLQLFIDSSTK